MDSSFNDKEETNEPRVYASGISMQVPPAVREHVNPATVIPSQSSNVAISTGNARLLQNMAIPHGAVILPNIITNDIVPTSTAEGEDSVITNVIGGTYATLNATGVGDVILTYPPGEGVIPQPTDLSEKDRQHTDDLSSKDRFQNTLVGCIAQLMKDFKRPMTLEDIVININPGFTELRKMDGTRYKGNISKAITGALSSTGIFKRTENGKWYLNEGEFLMYEQRTQKKLETKSKRKREITQEEEKTSRKYAKRRDRRQAIISMLDSLSAQYRQENPERSLIYSRNPFELARITGVEDVEGLQKKLGSKFLLCMQLYAYFEDLFKLATGDAQIGIQKAFPSGDSVLSKDIVYLKMEIQDLRNRIEALEKEANL